MDLSKVDRFNGKSVQLTGISGQSHITLGDLDYWLYSFQNAIISTGSGFNTVIIKEGDVGNSYKLGGGGDTIEISGDRNFVDAGAGANSVTVRGSGSNTLLSGPGADIVKLTSKTAYLMVADWDPNLDRIDIAGDLIGTKVNVIYNPSSEAYIVSADDRVIAALYTEDTKTPKIDSAGVFQGTSIVPIDFRAEKTVFINEVYTQALDRAPDRSGLAYWMNSIDSSVSRGAFIKAVFAGDEFTKLHESNSSFVDELYVDFLGRAADVAGKQAYLNFLDAGGSRADVIEWFIQSPEFVQLVGQVPGTS
jgi:hypothetical protein